MADGISSTFSRRSFMRRSVAGTLTALACPAIASADKSGSRKPIVGVGEFQYEVDHQWAKLPDRFNWQTTQNVAIDSTGLVYVIHKGQADKPDHDAIFVFDAAGKFVRSFGKQFQGGGHGLEVRQEGSEEVLYVAAYRAIRSFAKLTLTGETVWHKYAPMEAGIFAEGENKPPVANDVMGRDRFLPTNFAFHPDGGFYLADGYGSYRIHRYDAAGGWQGMFGVPSDPSGEEKPDGTFNIPHGLWIDDRGTEPLIVVADRANARLQWFSLDGRHRRTQSGFLLPANIDLRDKLLVVPDLIGRVTLLDGENQVIAHLGDDSARIAAEGTNFQIRNDESRWIDGKFVHPHDACFDADGNIIVAEWVSRGRISKLRKLA